MARFPPGFRFHPTDVELVKYYLKRKVTGRKLHFEAIAEVDIYKHAPWDLPEKSGKGSRDLKWYFFCPREKKYANGARMNRATEYGYWKTTGKDRFVQYNNEVVGWIKTLVFHRGKAPQGDRTDWVMHEYRLDDKDLANKGVAQDAYVLCIVFQKDGPGPRNGAQYGAPFREEDWDDDEDVDGMEVVSSAFLSTPVPNQINPVAASSFVPETQCIGASESCLSGDAPSAYKALSPIPVNNDVPTEVAQGLGEDDILSLLAHFTEDGTLVSDINGQNEKLDNDHTGNAEAPTSSDGIDIYNDLGDLNNLGGLSGGKYDFLMTDNAGYNLNQRSWGDDMSYLELLDLDVPLNCPAEAGDSGGIHNDNLYADQNCYNSEQSHHPVNSWLDQSPPMMPVGPDNIEDQLAVFLKGNVVRGNPNQSPLNHGDSTLFNQLPQRCSHFSGDVRSGGSYYPW